MQHTKTCPQLFAPSVLRKPYKIYTKNDRNLTIFFLHRRYVISDMNSSIEVIKRGVRLMEQPLPQSTLEGNLQLKLCLVAMALFQHVLYVVEIYLANKVV